MGSLEYITPEGLRIDGRHVDEPRRVCSSIGRAGDSEADGYAVFELGTTKAIAYVYGPMEVRQRSQVVHTDRATLSCVLSTAAFGTTTRTWRPRGDRMSQERSVWIQQSLESAVLLSQYPRSHIRVFVQILEADGAGIAAAINAATLALVDAGIQMRDLVVACSAGMLGRQPAVDLNRDEEFAGGAQLLLAELVGSKNVVLLEVESKVPDGEFARLHDMASTGCQAVAQQMKIGLLEHATRSFSLRFSLRSGQKS